MSTDILTHPAYIFVSNNPQYQNLSPGEISTVAQQTIENNTGVFDFVNSMFSSASIHPADPRAFLVYIMLDEHFQVVPELSGALQAENPDVLDLLAVTNLRINTNGFLYVYVNNSSVRPVFFDNLFINHTSSHLLDKSDYYPFGMLWKLPDQNNDLENNYKYNGKELQKDLALYTEDYGARHYDPCVERWLQVDPLSEKYRRWSPYNYGVDNPVRFIDPDGRSGDTKFESAASAQMIGREGLDKNEYNKATDKAVEGVITGVVAETIVGEICTYLKIASDKKPSGLGDLTKGEVKKIQKEVDRAERPIEVVGSAAKGERRNPGSSLPFGKAKNEKSDIDYTTHSQYKPYYDDSKLPELDPKYGILEGSANSYESPYIRFEPNTDPVQVPLKK